MIEQIIIAVAGVLSVWLSQDKREEYRKWACIAGLLAQPAWMYATYQAGQWGIFALSFVYAADWLRGFYNHWYLPYRYEPAVFKSGRRL